MADAERNVASIAKAVTADFIRGSGGFAVHVLRGQKSPMPGWDPKANNSEKSEALLAGLQQNDDNIGLHFHGSLVDVDVDGDNPFLTVALDTFLPPCSHVWGRKSRPRTHRAYIVSDEGGYDPTAQLILRRLKRISEACVEVRGGAISRGEYSLLPPSIHPSGEVYEWADIGRAKSTPSVVELSSIINGIRMSAAVAVLAPFWVEGVRQEMAMAITGLCHRAMKLAEAISPEAFALDLTGVKRLVDVIMRVTGDDPSDRGARKAAIESTWRKAEEGTPVTGGATLARICGDDRIVSKLYSLLSEGPDVDALDEFMGRFAIWRGPAVVIDMEQLRKGSSKPFMTRPAFSSSYGDKFILVGEKQRLIADLLWSMKATTRVYGVTFDPTEGEFVETRTGTMVNVWAGFEVPASPNTVKSEDIKPFLEYVKDVLASGDADAMHWILSWCADIFQDPGNKPGTALVLVGVEGAGKSVLGHEVLGKIIGSAHYASTNSVDNVVRSFNVSFANKLLLQCDEATNSKQRSMAARMNALITDPTQLVEPKGVDAYFNPSLARFMFTSNDVDDAIYIRNGANDRRYTVIEASSKRSAPKEVEEYWEPFVEWLGSPGVLANIHRYLRDYKYKKSMIRRPFQSAARSRLQQNSWDPFDSWLAAMLARGHPLSEKSHEKPYSAYAGTCGAAIDRSDWPEWVDMGAMVNDFHQHCRANKVTGGDAMNEVHMSMALDRRSIKGPGEPRRLSINEFDPIKNLQVRKRIRVYPAPPLEAIRKYLERRYGFDHDPEQESASEVINRTEDKEEF